MKILVVCQYYAPEPFRIPDICRGLTERGHQVTVVTGTPNYPEGIIYEGYENGQHRDEVLDGVQVHRCPLIPRKQGAVHRFLNYYSFPYYAGKYLKTLKDDFDVVFVNQLSPVMMAEPALYWAKKNRKKCFLYCLDLWPESLLAGGIQPGSPIYQFFLHTSRRIYRRADAISVTSGGFLSYFKEKLGIEEERLSYLPQYAEGLFDDLPAADEKKEGTDFLFAGNIGTMQSAETIVEAAKLLKDRQDIRIHLVGGGVSLDRCRALAGNLPNLHFYGRRPLEEMPSFYAMADAMLITLKKDPVMSMTLPGKVQSYMAAGKPVIGSIDGETPRILREARCGDCVGAENPEALAELIKRAAADPACLKTWGRNARSYYLEHFSREVFLDRLEKMLETACQ